MKKLFIICAATMALASCTNKQETTPTEIEDTNIEATEAVDSAAIEVADTVAPAIEVVEEIAE